MSNNLNKELTIDDVIFNIEDYVGGNIEGNQVGIDRMAFTVFLRSQLESFKNNAVVAARIDELENITFGAVSIYPGQMPVRVIENRLAELKTLTKKGQTE